MDRYPCHQLFVTIIGHKRFRRQTKKSFSMNRIFLSFALLATLSIGFSQSKRFATDIKETLYIHDTASSIASEIVALNAFKDLVEKYPNEWLPAYWTAYLSTQVWRLYDRPEFPKDLDAEKLLWESKDYLDKSVRIKGDMSDEERSDFLMLEGFIYGFMEYAVPEEKKEEYENLRKAKYKEATKYNSRNPLMFVLQGTNMIRKDKYQEVATGIWLLDYAEQIFEKADNRGLTTHWNKDFIKFWRARGEEKLKGLLDG